MEPLAEQGKVLMLSSAPAEHVTAVGGGKSAAAATLASSAARAMSGLGISPSVGAVPQVCVCVCGLERREEEGGIVTRETVRDKRFLLMSKLQVKLAVL